MLRMLQMGLLLLTCLHVSSCNGQTTSKETSTLSDDFDTAMPFYYNIPKTLSSQDTSPAFDKGGRKILLTGTVYEFDGKTPASNVILYYYQTNPDGIYATKADEERNMPKNKLGQTHGYIRGWVKTDANGSYAIYTTLPGSYPSSDEAAHIHISVKEPNMKAPYYLDNFVFDNDSLLTTEKRSKMENRGGSGIVRFVEKDGLWIGERTIILGLHIPKYPIQSSAAILSGKHVGEDVLSFTPYHAYGVDTGTKTCPVCKYGWYHGILYFVGNRPDWEEIKSWLTYFDALSQERKNYLKVYFVYGNESNYDKNLRTARLAKLGTELDLKHVALTFVPSFSDSTSEIYRNNINPEVANTILMYKRSTIIEKYINLAPTQQNFDTIRDRLDKTTNEYFLLTRPKQQ